MRRFLMTTVFTLFAFDVRAAESETKTYARFGLDGGIIKMKGNDYPSMGTAIMYGFTAAIGAAFPIENSPLVIRAEGAYMFGYHPTDIEYGSTNYSALFLRGGFEIDTKKAVIPYVLFGIGAAAIDPPDDMVNTGFTFETTFGARIPVTSTLSIDTGFQFARAFVKYPTKSSATLIDQMMGHIGIHKTF